MADDKIINKIIERKCKEIFPKDVFRKGSSRVYFDDNGYYLTLIEFQPYSLKRGTFLNVGLSFLCNKNDSLCYDFSYDNEIRVGRSFVEFVDETQFENDIVNYIEIAKDYIFKYRKFRDVLYAKEYMINNLDDSNWNPYYKAMFCFLTDDIFPGQKYYQLFLDNSFFERIMKQDNYPEKVEDLNKEYVLDMIRNQRHYWHSKTAMKKMKNYPEWE